MSAERLRELAEKVRAGEAVDWSRELDAMVLEQAADDAEFAEKVGTQINERIEHYRRNSIELEGLPGIGG